MQLGRNIPKRNVKEIPTRRNSRRMERLLDIAQEMRNPFQRIRTRQICPGRQPSALRLPNTLLQYLCLVRDRRDNTAALGAIAAVVEVTHCRWVIAGIDPVPLVREGAFVGVRVGVGPGCGAPDGAVVLRFEDALEDRSCVGVKEFLGHEADLVVDCGVLVWTSAHMRTAYHLCSTLRSKQPASLQRLSMKRA